MLQVAYLHADAATKRSRCGKRNHGTEEVKHMESTSRKAYTSPRLEVFGTVTELTLNACNVPGSDNKSCRNLLEEGRSTPGSVQPPFQG